VITIDVLPGLVIGVAAMLLLVIWHASRPHLSELGRVPDVPSAYGDVLRHPNYLAIPGLLVVRLETPLFYANATPVRDGIKQLVGAADPTPKTVIIDLGANERLDSTSAEMLAQLLATLRSAGTEIAIADARQPVIEMAHRSGLLDQLGQDHLFHTIDEAVQESSR